MTSPGTGCPASAGPARRRRPSPAEPDHLVRIVAALVKPPGPAPEAETVTLLNTSPAEIDLAGWSLADRAGGRLPLSGRLAAGAASRVAVAAPAQLGNGGGTLTLLDSRGLKVDGVAWTADQGRREGWTVVF
jgi:hypothetical protein